MCLANGTWSEKTDYSNCSMFEPILEVKNGDYSDVIYMVGYAVSLIALTIALFIFLKFRYCLFIIILHFINYCSLILPLYYNRILHDLAFQVFSIIYTPS